MSGSHLGKMSRLAVIVSVGLSTMAVGCGKSASVTQSAHTTQAVLTQTQAIAAGDAVCATAIKEVQPLVAQVEATHQGGPVLEQIGGRTREASRMLGELHVPSAVQEGWRNYESSLNKLATIEEQLGQAEREVQTARLDPLKQDVREDRAYADRQAKAVGFRVCGASPRTPVG